jgi:hypothetical protein
MAAASVAISSQVSPAQPSAPAAAPARVDGRTVVAEMRRLLNANYVLPEVRPKLDAALAKGLAEGRYDTSDPAVLLDRVNADLTAVAHDKHLSRD